MGHAVTVYVSLLIGLGAAAGITWFVMNRVRRSSADAREGAAGSGVLFIVCARRWQSMLLRVTGLIFVAAGFVVLLIGLVVGGSSAGAAFGGAGIVVVGFVFLWMAAGVAKARIEVREDGLRVFRWTGGPSQVTLSEVTRLEVLRTNNYGGLVVWAGKRRALAVNRLALGYDRLIDHIRAGRPDLAIPDAALPL